MPRPRIAAKAACMTRGRKSSWCWKFSWSFLCSRVLLWKFLIYCINDNGRAVPIYRCVFSELVGFGWGGTRGCALRARGRGVESPPYLWARRVNCVPCPRNLRPSCQNTVLVWNYPSWRLMAVSLLRLTGCPVVNFPTPPLLLNGYWGGNHSCLE
jgi:hypothetical protein